MALVTEAEAPMLYTSSFLRMSIAHFFTVSSFGSFFLFPLFILGHGGSKADTGIIMGVFGLASVLSRPWISNMIDRMGRKRSYLMGTLIMAALPLAYLSFRGDLEGFYLPLLLVRVFHGVGLAIIFTAAFTYIADIVPEGRLNEGIGMFGVTGLAGLAAGPAISEVIIQSYGFSECFVFASLMAMVGWLVAYRLPESYVRQPETTGRSFFSVLGQKKSLTVAFIALLFGIGLSASGTFVSPYARERDLAFITIYYLSYSSAAILTRIVGGRIADRVGEERVIPYALILTGSGMLLLLFLGGLPTLALAGFMTGCGHGFLFPCLNALAVRDEPVEIRGKVTGVFTGSIDAGALAGAVSLGFIGEWAGYRALFLTASLALFAGLGVLKFVAFRAGGTGTERIHAGGLPESAIKDLHSP